ncbi:MAG: MGMT family protein [Brachybacterium sp.]|nr:MGMT family protein [Brachybacterium sp.]
MSSERVYTIAAGAAVPLETVSLTEAGLRERQDLQEWVLARPEILGPDVIVVAFEFDRWQNARGEPQRDRLDILGLDADGRLVLAELKRDEAPDTVQMQAIKYAAMASRFTEADLVTYHARFLSQRAGETVSEDVARVALLDHAGELDPDQLRQPRIVLVAGAFTVPTSASVVWLTEMGLDITMQRVQAYRLGDDGVIVTVSQLFPVPDVEEFTISPQRAEAQQSKARRTRQREGSTVRRLVRHSIIPDGSTLTLAPTTDIDAETREQIQEWVAEDPRRGRATWINGPQPLRWQYDGELYRPTNIVKQVLFEAAQITRSANGPTWWITDEGVTLTELAAATDGGFDWSALHDILAALPPGRWTTYGDLATTVGTAAQPLGGHVMACGDCVNAFRVLDASGRTRPGFRWNGDPDDERSQTDALEAEGIRFDGGRADPALRLPMEELIALRPPGSD